MSSNHLNLGIQVSYQGQVHDFKATIDLDARLAAHGALPDFHNLVARASQVDTYSYLFEAMQMEPVAILDAQGRAADFVTDGTFDMVGYIEDWHTRNALPGLQRLATQLLEIDDLEQHPKLKQALLAAYQQGFQTAQSS
ncbi:MAG: hypothetical protein IBX48_08185 [Thiomicrospira sp.]|uniref:hypothetical protein n=1 Tax=Thiomicrospira sp. TaxID=935 RepID=UPI0019DD5B73|nr:hypothetical protein [Thiomicrospira sp.]MBE0494308.1 hypothetical protein [Thiomicrospira sp.]